MSGGLFGSSGPTAWFIRKVLEPPTEDFGDGAVRLNTGDNRIYFRTNEEWLHLLSNSNTLSDTENITLDVIRTESNLQVIDINITDTSQRNFNYIDIRSTSSGGTGSGPTAGNKTMIHLDIRAADSGEALAIYTFAKSEAGDAYGINTEATSIGGGRAYGAFLIGYDQAGETASGIWGAFLSLGKSIAGSTVIGLQMDTGEGALAIDTGIQFTGDYVDAVDLSAATITGAAIKLGNGQEITTSAGTLTLNSADGKVNFAGATRTASTVTHDAYVDLDIGGSTYKFMLGS